MIKYLLPKTSVFSLWSPWNPSTKLIDLNPSAKLIVDLHQMTGRSEELYKIIVLKYAPPSICNVDRDPMTPCILLSNNSQQLIIGNNKACWKLHFSNVWRIRGSPLPHLTHCLNFLKWSINWRYLKIYKANGLYCSSGSICLQHELQQTHHFYRRWFFTVY